MNTIISIGTVLLMSAGILLVFTRHTVGVRGFAGQRARPASGTGVLFGFAGVAFAYLAFLLAARWDVVIASADKIFLAVGLVLTMIAGMIVRVVSSNYQASRQLFQVDWQQLVFPMLFCPIVFFPVWSIASEGGSDLFVFHAAFLNGYFWESIVASAQSSQHDAK